VIWQTNKHFLQAGSVRQAIPRQAAPRHCLLLADSSRFCDDHASIHIRVEQTGIEIGARRGKRIAPALARVHHAAGKAVGSRSGSLTLSDRMGHWIVVDPGHGRANRYLDNILVKNAIGHGDGHMSTLDRQVCGIDRGSTKPGGYKLNKQFEQDRPGDQYQDNQ